MRLGWLPFALALTFCASSAGEPAVTRSEGQAGSEGAGRPNRLVNEKSPYLLQHAFNPVDWYPWGNEAFETARRQNKPIFRKGFGFSKGR